MNLKAIITALVHAGASSAALADPVARDQSSACITVTDSSSRRASFEVLHA